MKAGVKYKIICYKKRNYNNIKYPNLNIFHLHLEKSLQIRDKNDKRESSKRE